MTSKQLCTPIPPPPLLLTLSPQFKVSSLTKLNTFDLSLVASNIAPNIETNIELNIEPNIQLNPILRTKTTTTITTTTTTILLGFDTIEINLVLAQKFTKVEHF